MNKSLALKNKLYLFFLLLVSLLIFIYLIYFLNRGIISFFKISKENSIYKNELISLNKKNKYLEGRIKRLKTNSLDLDFLDEKIREKTGYIYEDEVVIIFK